MTDTERLREEREEVLRQAKAMLESADDRELQGDERRVLNGLLDRAASLLDQIRRLES